MDSPNTKISRGNWSLVVVRKFIAERIISYRNGNENSGILLTNRDFHLQTGNLDYKTGLSFTKRESCVTNGILGLLFTNLPLTPDEYRYKCIELESKSDQLFKDLGTDTTSAIRMFLTQAVAYNGFPFEIKRTVHNPYTSMIEDEMLQRLEQS